MKRFLILILQFVFLFQSNAQLEIRSNKYPSLLWEISGKGMKKPSYLIGTMHVSSKLAFNLPDSFYMAIRGADVVALETNPETWQEDMSKYDIGGDGFSAYKTRYENYSSVPSDYLSINTLKFYKYDKKIERALYSNPSAINNLLYRSYGNESSDFEEDTYLDMYIFQCGKKWGKKIAGVENYSESMRLMAEAYKDAAKDKNRKDRSYGDWEDAYSSDKLQEAYRRGNLDLLDSINKYNSFSAAFDEKFLYRRNEIQANSIDSILRKGSSLFVGVGAAHLPNERGVIELLRSKGYKLRPVKMGERASKEKDLVDKVRVPVIFRTETADDGLFKVDIPGQFHQFGDDAALDQQQYADMANGSYYLVTRIMTNAWMWSHTTNDVYRVVDSLLYENVPGKIISKTAITRNGYKGFDVVNRTRRGDIQRYHIFITPYEIIFFKMGGNGDYVKNGPEATKFFGSIWLKEFKQGEATITPAKKYSPAYGGFAVDMPHEPYMGNDGSWIFDATAPSGDLHYRVIKTTIHNYHFAGEDTFDLGLMDESFMASEFIDTQLSRHHFNYRGYPALDGKYRDKSGNIYYTRFLIQGPHYYSLIVKGKQETGALAAFLNSFEIKPFVYGPVKLQKDTALYYSVVTSYYPQEGKIKLDIPRSSWGSTGDDGEEQSEKDLLEAGVYRNKVISNDSTGEKVFLSFFRSSRYHYIKDSLALERDDLASFFSDTTVIYKMRKKTALANRTKVWEAVITDTGSSRTLWTKVFYKKGMGFTIATESDSLSQPSSFIRSFFETFTPVDSLKGTNPFEKKSTLFFSDLNSPDSTLHKMALRQISDITLDAGDLPQVKKAIASINWEEKKYLEAKKEFINKLGIMDSPEVADYLGQLYYSLDDTVDLQYAVLENLLQQRTKHAYGIFRDIINTEPPVLISAATDYSATYYPDMAEKYFGKYFIKNGKFLDELSDSLELTRTILPELLPLVNLQDYKSTIMNLLSHMIDSNLVQPKDYEAYFSKFLVEAKQELKKQSIAEKKRAITKAEESKTGDKKPSYLLTEEKDDGNADLSLYANLLLPFQDNNSAVRTVIQQMLRSGDKRLKYNTFLLLLQKNKPYPDTLLSWFAAMNDYRYELYRDLKQQNKLQLFPSKYNNQPDLAQSALLKAAAYEKPDTLVFLQKLKTAYKDRSGFIYFYKYKAKKDDLGWKLATVGILPKDTTKFEFDGDKENFQPGYSSLMADYAPQNWYDFTGFSETRLIEDQPLTQQLNLALKKMLYSRRESAREFYKNDERSGTPDL
ncbi:MAG TPA: TraB/GumN family protein [Chitinophagaceae bacterium]|nr:TraB/GumN family protein [Chitinophagaceae bacterium]